MEIFKRSLIRMSYSGLGGNKFVQIGKYNIPRTLVRSLILFFLVISGLVNAGLSIIGYADGIGTVLYSLSITSVYVFATLVYITMLLKTNEIVKLYEYMENMIVQRSRLEAELFKMYQTRNVNIERFIKKLYVSALCVVILINVIPLLCPIFYITIGYPTPDLWITAYGIQMLSPLFLTPVGFEAVALISVVIALTTLLDHFCFISFFVSIGLNIECILDDTTITAARLNTKISQKRMISVESDLKQLVDLHLHLYTIMEMLQDIVRSPIFYQILFYPLQAAALFFEFEANLEHFKFTFISGFCGLSWLTALNYILCYYTTTSTLNAMAFGDRIYDSHWYHLTFKEQVIVQMVIQRSQREYEFKGLDLFTCSLQTYLMMIRSALSYFMIFRKL